MQQITVNRCASGNTSRDPDEGGVLAGREQFTTNINRKRKAGALREDKQSVLVFEVVMNDRFGRFIEVPRRTSML